LAGPSPDDDHGPCHWVGGLAGGLPGEVRVVLMFEGGGARDRRRRDGEVVPGRVIPGGVRPDRRAARQARWGMRAERHGSDVR
jgi:hypothetical protein